MKPFAAPSLLRSRLLVSAMALVFALSPALRAATESEVKARLRDGLKARDKALVKAALDEAATLDGSKGVKLILGAAIQIGVMGMIDEMVEALRKTPDEDELIKAATRHKTPDIRYLAVRAFAGRKSDGINKALAEALDDKSELVAVAAVRVSQGVVTKDFVDSYVKMLAAEQKAGAKGRSTLMRELVTALKNVTEQDDIEDAVDWENYWKTHREEWRAPDAATGSDDDVIGRMKEHRKSDVKTLERLAKTDVIVIKGSSDKVELILKDIKIEHRIVDRDEFLKLELPPSAVLVLNCNGNKSNFTDEELTKLSTFVAQGGYLFSSDWQLKFTIEKAFPNTIGFGGESKRTESGQEEVVPIEPSVANHPYMRDVFPLSTLERLGYQWKIDGRSHLITMKAPRGVVPLIESSEMKKSYKNNVVAATFRWNGRLVADTRVATGAKGEKPLEGGSVLHVLGHFKNQRDKSDKFALQQLLLNFILEKQREKRLAGGR